MDLATPVVIQNDLLLDAASLRVACRRGYHCVVPSLRSLPKLLELVALQTTIDHTNPPAAPLLSTSKPLLLTTRVQLVLQITWGAVARAPSQQLIPPASHFASK